MVEKQAYCSKGVAYEKSRYCLGIKNLVIALVLVIVGFALPNPSRAAGANMGTLGYWDPTTSTFVPMLTPKVLPLASPVTRTGTVKVNITLSIESSIGTDQAISCSASILSSDASFFNQASTDGIVVRSGATGTVTMTIPYLWTMAATGELANVFASCNVENFSTGSITRFITFTVPGFVVPVTAGAITTKSLHMTGPSASLDSRFSTI